MSMAAPRMLYTAIVYVYHKTMQNNQYIIVRYHASHEACLSARTAIWMGVRRLLGSLPGSAADVLVLMQLSTLQHDMSHAGANSPTGHKPSGRSRQHADIIRRGV
jgi:hypothetical protein